MPRSCWHRTGDEVFQEKSFGILPVAMRGAALSAFLIQNFAGLWGLPKGHAEGAELPKEAAARELKEETGLIVEIWLDLPPYVERYPLRRGARKVRKEVVYFPALVSGVVELQAEEVKAGRWVALHEAEELATFPEVKAIVRSFSAWCATGKFPTGEPS